ncbi:MAG: DUF47 domain-containing protein [Bacteroidales bacterium]
MKFNNILSIFSPKDVKFLPMFEEAAIVLVNASALLRDLFVSENPEEIRNLCKLIKAEEVKGDKIAGKISKALNDTFITPFDREDIHELSDSLDDAIDAMNRSAQKVLLYAPKNQHAGSTRLSEIVYLGAVELQKAIHTLSTLRKNNSPLAAHCKEVKRLEEEADVVYETAIMNLFREESSVAELIKLKEIIQELEKSVNRLNTVAKVLKTLIVKYA